MTRTDLPAEWTVEPGFERVARFFASQFGRGGGGALVVRHRGRVVVDAWAGYADGRGERPWTPDTLAIGFSTAKGAVSTVMHRLVEQGLLEYDAPVARYWPEFAARGKAEITVRRLLSHEAGLHSVRGAGQRAEDLLDHLAVEERLAERPPHRIGRPAYHALTYGWLTAGLARRVTGLGMAALVQREVAEPLGVGGMFIGRPPTGGRDVAELTGPALRASMTAGRLLVPVGGLLRIRRSSARALYVPGFDALFRGADPPVLDTEMPAANGLFTARALAALYAALAAGGRTERGRLLKAATVRELGRVSSRGRDDVLGIPMRWRLGYHQAFALGQRPPRAFGHYGFGGSGGWADPDSGLAVGYVTNALGAVTTPFGGLALFRLSGLVHAAAREGEAD
jgi:CubicO group peptidase (beta-lactamase class C family)